MSFFENTRKPVGLGGKIMVAMMNLGHSPVAQWGLQFLNVAPDAKVLDCGCGGGANMKRLLKKYPQGIVKGIDYSPVSVEKARSLNRAAIQEGRCVVWQGSVERIIFAKDWFDAVTAFETVYFWPDLPQCFREVYRVLKPGGAVFFASGVFYYFLIQQVRELVRGMADAFPGGVLVFDAANRTAVKMIAKTWLKTAKIKDVGAYFAV